MVAMRTFPQSLLSSDMSEGFESAVGMIEIMSPSRASRFLVEHSGERDSFQEVGGLCSWFWIVLKMSLKSCLKHFSRSDFSVLLSLGEGIYLSKVISFSVGILGLVFLVA